MSPIFHCVVLSLQLLDKFLKVHTSSPYLLLCIYRTGQYLNYCYMPYMGVNNSTPAQLCYLLMCMQWNNIMTIYNFQSSDFGPYVTYCKNKPTSDHARAEHEVFFTRRQSELGQKLNIEDLLIAPVQRLPKYQLLIRVSVWVWSMGARIQKKRLGSFSSQGSS